MISLPFETTADRKKAVAFLSSLEDKIYPLIHLQQGYRERDIPFALENKGKPNLTSEVRRNWNWDINRAKALSVSHGDDFINFSLLTEEGEGIDLHEFNSEDATYFPSIVLEELLKLNDKNLILKDEDIDYKCLRGILEKTAGGNAYDIKIPDTGELFSDLKQWKRDLEAEEGYQAPCISAKELYFSWVGTWNPTHEFELQKTCSGLSLQVPYSNFWSKHMEDLIKFFGGVPKN